jgi:hypothetical protein
MTPASAMARPELSAAWHLESQRRRDAALAILAVCGSLLLAGGALLAHVVAVVLLAAAMTAVAILWRPRIGLYVIFGLVLTFEAGSPDELMIVGAYLHGPLSSMVGLPGVVASPLELLLLLTAGAWLLGGVVHRRLDFRGGRLGVLMALFTGALVFGLLRGQAGGGNLTIALWESRFLFYAVVCYFLATNTIRTRRHVVDLIAIALVTMGAWAVEGAYRRAALIDTGLLGSMMEFAYSHEVVIFLGALLLLVLAQHVFGAPVWQRLLGLPLVPIATYTLLATERRSGYIAVMVAFLALAVVFLVAHRRAFCLVVIPALVGGAIYLPIFWNDTGLLGQPARAVRSLSEPDPRDAASNLYRELEKINVRATIASDPLLGVGFGREFLFAVGMPDLSFWPMWHYTPHHNVLWIWLKTGAVGFTIFLALAGLTVAWAAHAIKTLRAPELRVFATLALVGTIASLVFCYVDLGLTAGRVTVFLGTLMGTLASLDRLDGADVPSPIRARIGDPAA